MITIGTYEKYLTNDIILALRNYLTCYDIKNMSKFDYSLICCNLKSMQSVDDDWCSHCYNFIITKDYSPQQEIGTKYCYLEFCDDVGKLIKHSFSINTIQINNLDLVSMEKDDDDYKPQLIYEYYDKYYKTKICISGFGWYPRLRDMKNDIRLCNCLLKLDTELAQMRLEYLDIKDEDFVCK